MNFGADDNLKIYIEQGWTLFVRKKPHSAIETCTQQNRFSVGGNSIIHSPFFES